MKLEQFHAEIVPQREALCMKCPMAKPCEPLGTDKSGGICYCGRNHAPLRHFIRAPHLACPAGRYHVQEVELPPAPPPAPDHGPGTEMKKLISATTGIENPVEGCPCQKLIDQMNRWGVEGCREPKNFAHIVKHLLEQKDKLATYARQAAKEHKPTVVQRAKLACARVATKVSPESMQRAGIEWLVNLAIDRAAEAEKTISP